MRLIDLTGKRINMLVVKCRSGRKGKNALWECECDCGNTVIVSSTHLMHGDNVQKSCGCARKSQNGMSSHSLYNTWFLMHERCKNKENKSYSRYGGRGITVCKRWESFSEFIGDMGERPTPEHSIDRIDNSRGYSPDNCRWATKSEQALNRRHRVSIKTAKNKTGIPGVSFAKHRNKWEVRFDNKYITRREDFFEACCVRLSLESKLIKELSNV